MIIDSDYFLSYLKASNLSIGRLDDDDHNFWLKDWFKDFPKKNKIFIHSFPQNEQDIEKIISFCSSHIDHCHVVILSGQILPLEKLASFVDENDRVFVLNDYNFSSDKFFPVISAHRTFGQGYINKVEYFPWRNRKILISALSSRYEPHRWIIVGALNLLQRSDVQFSFHNAYPQTYDIDHFIQSAKEICDFEVPQDLQKSIEQLISQAPIVPGGMHTPRPNGITTDKTFIYDQCELNVYVNSKINLTMEGQFVDTNYGCNITEKTMKCLATGCFPIHVGQSGFYKFLSKMGFDFDVDVDLSFDNLPGDCRKQKLKLILDLIKSITASETLEKVSQKNYNWFHNNWYDYCETLNTPVLAGLKERLLNEI